MTAMATHRSLVVLAPLLLAAAAVPSPAAAGGRRLRSLARHSNGGKPKPNNNNNDAQKKEQQIFCHREIVDPTDELDGTLFRTIASSAEIAAVAARDALKIATGDVKLLAGPCSNYCAGDDANFDMNAVREMCGPTAYDCQIGDYGSGTCWMAIDAEEEFDEDEAVEGTWDVPGDGDTGSGSGFGSDSGSGSSEEDGDDMSAGKVEWNEEAQEYEVEVEAGYDEGDAVVYDEETGSVVAASEEEDQDQDQEEEMIVTVTEEETSSVVIEEPEGEPVAMAEQVVSSSSEQAEAEDEAEEEEEEEQESPPLPPNCVACHYFDRARWIAAGKKVLPESFYDTQTNDPDKPEECLNTGHWFDVIGGKTCEQIFAWGEGKYKICAQKSAGGRGKRCESEIEWSPVDARGKIYGTCAYLCETEKQSGGDDGESEDADQR